MDVMLFKIAKNCRDEVGLQERFTAGYGHASLPVEREIVIEAFKDFRDGHQAAGGGLPGIRIMAVLATQGTAA